MKLVSGLAAAVLLLALAGPVAAADPTPTPLPADCTVSSDGAITCPVEGGGTGGSSGGSSGSGGSTDPSTPIDPGLSPEPVPSLLIEPAPSAIAIPMPAECPADATCAPTAVTCVSNQDGTTSCTAIEPGLLPSCEPIVMDPSAPDATTLPEGDTPCVMAATGTIRTMNGTDMIATTGAGVAEDAMLTGSGESLGLITVGLVVLGTLLGAVVGLIAGLRLKGSRAA